MAFAEFAHVVAEKYPVNIALHTDHCPLQKLDGYMRPLVDISLERVANGQQPLFQSHMWDGSAIPLEENLDIADELLDKCHKANIIMEIEIGVVGGEEDGIEAKHDAKLFSTRKTASPPRPKFGLGERGRYLVAATFGNVHGVYKPGNVVLTPSILKGDSGHRRCQVRRRQALRPGVPRRLGFAAHRDSRGAGLRRRQDERRHRHPVRLHPPGGRLDAVQLRRRTQGGRRRRQQKKYDLRAWGRAAEDGMAARVVEACTDLRSAGTKMA